MRMKNSAGSFSNFREITKEENQLFEETLKNYVGVGRKPLAIATQVVNGTNYAFLCEAKIVYPEAIPYNDIVVIYQPREGKPILKEIKEIEIL